MRPTVENVLFLHTVAIEAFGGSEGVRDLESLHAGVARYFLIAFAWALLLSVKRTSAIGLSGLWVHTLQRGLTARGAECLPPQIPA